MKKTITTCDIEKCENEVTEARVIYMDGVQYDICEHCLARLFKGKNKVPTVSLQPWIYPYVYPYSGPYFNPWVQVNDGTANPPTTITWGSSAPLEHTYCSCSTCSASELPPEAK